MFGYIRVDDPNLYKKDDVLYNSMYCSICKCIGSNCGQMARLSLTYDIVFLSVFAHNVIDVDVEIKRKNCIAHWFKKRPIASKDDINKFMADINLILAYYKVQDDLLDNKKGKIKKIVLSKGFKKANKRHPEISKIVVTQYEKLRNLENKKCDSLDIVSDPFAEMLKQISTCVLGDKSTEYSENLFYNLGKWIYLTDALDDYEKDIKNNNYNPFVILYGGKPLLESLNSDSDFSNVYNGIFRGIKDNFEKITFNFNTDLIKNILFGGLQKKTLEILKKEKKNGKNI